LNFTIALGGIGTLFSCRKRLGDRFSRIYAYFRVFFDYFPLKSDCFRRSLWRYFKNSARDKSFGNHFQKVLRRYFANSSTDYSLGNQFYLFLWSYF